MDYIGQPVQSPDASNDDLFSEALTAGVGIAHEKINDSGESLDSGAYRDNRNVGKMVLVSEQNQEPVRNQNNIIDFPRHANHESLQSTPENFESEELGKVIPMMPPGMEGISDAKTADSINESVIRTNKKTLEKAGVREVNKVILEFNQTGDAAKLYDKTRLGMTKINLKNSFNRELAA